MLDLQSTLDKLYAESKNNCCFRHLMQYVASEDNIKLAYRNIKKNKGSKTAGADGKTIEDLNKWSISNLISHIQKRLKWYQPNKIRRVEIPKDNGKTRPLGIPTIMDRLIQQCFLQILEPICEAKFFERSNGFRPNRSAENAISQVYKMIQTQHLHYVVDVDIKSFFNNVSHGKLLKQIHCHHKIPYSASHDDSYGNLILICQEAPILIHAVNSEVIQHYKSLLNLNAQQVGKINKLRKLLNLADI